SRGRAIWPGLVCASIDESLCSIMLWLTDASRTGPLGRTLFASFAIVRTLHLDRALVEHRRDGTERGKDWRQHRPDDADRQRELGDSVLALLDDDPPNIAFVQQPSHGIDELRAGDLERLLPGFVRHNILDSVGEHVCTGSTAAGGD